MDTAIIIFFRLYTEIHAKSSIKSFIKYIIRKSHTLFLQATNIYYHVTQLGKISLTIMQDLTVLLMKMNFLEFHRYIYFLYSTARWQKNEGKQSK